jgi:hypothetical protein
MGVSGVGKSTIGQGLAEAMSVPFADADNFHPPANVAKMRTGTPLTDDDRWPWLDAIGAWLDARGEAGGARRGSAVTSRRSAIPSSERSSSKRLTRGRAIGRAQAGLRIKFSRPPGHHLRFAS